VKSADIIVVGAGAAGLTAAIYAASSGSRVLVLERTDKAGKKILMSGGTRCNVLPVVMSLSDYHTDSSPNLLRRIFKSWSVAACKDWFQHDLGLPLACEADTNKWFPVSNQARDVRDVLVNKLISTGAQILYNKHVTALKKDEQTQNWFISTEDGLKYSTHAVIWASGGLSVPTIGTDGSGHRVLKETGISITPTYPALTPLTGPHPGTDNLAGISLNVKLTAAANASSREGFLFTHKGFSGPAVLDASHHVTRYVQQENTTASQKPELSVNWSGDSEQVWITRFATGKGTVRSVIRDYLPNRLTDALLSDEPIADKRAAECSRTDRTRLIQKLTRFTLPWTGHEGYRKAEVTGGGVPLESIDTATMAHKQDPSLFLCGEIIDVFGRIGGFNFYWAWVSGRLAGLSAGRLSR